MGSLIEQGVAGVDAGYRDLGVDGEPGPRGAGWLMLRGRPPATWPPRLRVMGAMEWRWGGGGGRVTIRALEVDLDRGIGRAGTLGGGTVTPAAHKHGNINTTGCNDH